MRRSRLGEMAVAGPMAPGGFRLEFQLAHFVKRNDTNEKEKATRGSSLFQEAVPVVWLVPCLHVGSSLWWLSTESARNHHHRPMKNIKRDEPERNSSNTPTTIVGRFSCSAESVCSANTLRGI